MPKVAFVINIHIPKRSNGFLTINKTEKSIKYCVASFANEAYGMQRIMI